MNWAFKLAAAKYVNTPVNPADILLIWGKPIYPYWYFYVLIVFYLLFGERNIQDVNTKVILPILFACSLVSGLVETKEWFQVQHLLLYAFFFYIGILFIGRRAKGLYSYPCVVLLSVFSIITVMLFWEDESLICRIPMINALAPTGIVLVLVKLFSRAKLFEHRGLLNYLGKHSLEIYVIHCFFTAANRVVLTELGINNVYWSIGINVVISTVIPLIFAYTMGKIGLYDLFFRPINLIWKRKTEVQ